MARRRRGGVVRLALPSPGRVRRARRRAGRAPRRPAGRHHRPGLGGRGDPAGVRGHRADSSAEAVALARALRRPGGPAAAEGVALWATVGLHPHDAVDGVGGLDGRARRRAGAGRRPGGPGGRGHRRVRARLPLRPLAPPRPARGLRPPGRARPPPRPGPGDPHPRGVGRHVRRPGGPGGARAHHHPLLHRGARARPAGASTSAPRSRSAGSSPSRTPPRSARPPHCARSTGSSSRPTRRSSRRCPTGARPTSRPGSPWSAPAVAQVKGLDTAEVAEAPRPTPAGPSISGPGRARRPPAGPTAVVSRRSRR